jgi:hypothetical protein
LLRLLLSPQVLIPVTFEFDHIIPRSAGGETKFENLCLACPSCNSYKHDAQTAFDPQTREEVRLLHPHRDRWQEHFVWQDTKTFLLGLTPVARATIDRLHLNRLAVVELRELWVAFNKFPPSLR